MDQLILDPKFRRLTAVFFGIAATGTAILNHLYNQSSKEHNNAEYSQNAFLLLKEDKKAVQLLGGEPVKLKMLDLADVEVTPLKAKIKLRVKGNTRSGHLYTMSSREDETKNWQLQYAIMRVETRIKSWNYWLFPEEGLDSKDTIEDLHLGPTA